MRSMDFRGKSVLITGGTRGLGKAIGLEFGLAGATVFLTHRWGSADEAALVAALAEGTIAGAGLDVFETEPHAPDALTAFPNVVLTPHIGGHTTDSHQAMQDCVLANLEAAFVGKPLPYPVASGS